LFLIRRNAKDNIIKITLQGVFDLIQSEQLLNRLPEELPKLKKGFSVLTDLSELDNIDLDCRQNIEKMMDICNKFGASTVVRIIPDQSKDIGFNIMSSFHYEPKVKIHTCSSLEQAKHYIIWHSDAKVSDKIRIGFKILFANIQSVTRSSIFRAVIISVGFVGLIILRRLVGVFGASIGYLYVTLISLSGFWFRLKGGLISALLASLIFTAEVYFFQYWQARDIVVQSMYLRFAVYFLSGAVLGYLSQSEWKLKQKLEFWAGHDELTGFYNLRFLMRLLENEILRSKRYSKVLSVAIIDIDHFKNLNDKYGHLAGNDALKAFADVVKTNVRAEDMVGRYGGEEFIIVFPESDVRQALSVLERIKAKLAQLHVSSSYVCNDEQIKITFSAGIASFPLNGKSSSEIISVADSALYRAKNSGRNKIIVEPT
jgi:diguanylate cyclase (GGDEF)-like protein